MSAQTQWLQGQISPGGVEWEQSDMHYANSHVDICL